MSDSGRVYSGTLGQIDPVKLCYFDALCAIGYIDPFTLLKSSMQPDFVIINDFSKKDVPHRSVYHVRLKSGEEFKCYKICLQTSKLVNTELAQQISPWLYGRWLSIVEFPKIIQFKHYSKATQAELDLTYLLHAYTLLLNHSGLWKCLPRFEELKVVFYKGSRVHLSTVDQSDSLEKGY